MGVPNQIGAKGVTWVHLDSWPRTPPHL